MGNSLTLLFCCFDGKRVVSCDSKVQALAKSLRNLPVLLNVTFFVLILSAMGLTFSQMAVVKVTYHRSAVMAMGLTFS